MKSFKEYIDNALTEAKGYTVEVEVRDARKANDLAQDRYRGLYKNDGSNVFVFKKESDKEDFEADLLDQGLAVLEEAATKTFKRGDSVTVKNAKSYDAMMKDTPEGTVIGAMGGKVMVKVGSGQLNVDPKDLMLAEDSDDDKESLDEAVVHNSNNKLRLKAGSSEILITTKGNNVDIFVQEGRERVMFEGKSDDLKAIKDFFSKI